MITGTTTMAMTIDAKPVPHDSINVSLRTSRGSILVVARDAPANWINVDGSWNAWFTHHPGLRKLFETIGLFRKGSGEQRRIRPLVHDITKPLPFANEFDRGNL